MGLAIGLLDFNGEILSIARIFAFFPYFLAGTTFSRDTLEYYRKKAYRIGCLCGIALFVGFLIAFVDLPEFRLSFFLTYAFAVLIPDKKFCFSKLGAATMPIYLFHGMLFKYIEVETTSLTYVSSIPETIVFLVFCVTLSFLLTGKPILHFQIPIIGLSHSLQSIKKRQLNSCLFCLFSKYDLFCLFVHTFYNCKRF